MKNFKYVKSIDNDEIERSIERKIRSIIIEWKDDTLHPRFIKHEDWIGVCCDNGELYEDVNLENLCKAVQNYEESDVVLFSFSQYSDLESGEKVPRCYFFPAHIQAFQEFPQIPISIYPSIYMLFSGAPDWILLNSPDLDYFVLFGDPNFVRQVLSVSVDEAFQTILDKSTPQALFYYSWHTFFENLVHKLRDIYPYAKSGEIIEI